MLQTKILLPLLHAFLLLLPMLNGCNTKGLVKEKKVPMRYVISLKHGNEGWNYELQNRGGSYISNVHVVVDSSSGMILRALPQFHGLVNASLQKYLNQKMDSLAERFIGDNRTHCYYQLKYMDDTLLSFIVTQNTGLKDLSLQFYNYNLVTGKKILIDDFFREIPFRDSLIPHVKLFVGYANTLPGKDTLEVGWQEKVKSSRKKVVPAMFDNYSFSEQQFQFYLCTTCSD